MTHRHHVWLPTEINSVLMFVGPGSGPLLAAAKTSCPRTFCRRQRCWLRRRQRG
ncbi:PPE domain-containing protein [Mycobacterium leprae]|uniref:PPE domain-containing protein n=1 Tax=Mycobacterium leprae TaxID=1769 RepID=UPI0002F0A8E5